MGHFNWIRKNGPDISRVATRSVRVMVRGREETKEEIKMRRFFKFFLRLPSLLYFVCDGLPSRACVTRVAQQEVELNSHGVVVKSEKTKKGGGM